MLQTIKKYAVFLFYAAINGFITASGYVLMLTSGLFPKTSVSERVDIFSIDAVKRIDPVFLTAAFVCFTVVYFLIFFTKDKLYRQTVPISVLIFSFCVLTRSSYELTYLTIVLAAVAAVLVYVFKETFGRREYKIFEGKKLYIFMCLITVLAVLMLSAGCIARFYDFYTSTYDFGIFAQMYESMARDLTQTTTLERGMPMSHFHIHFSPIYYLLLPFYMIFRRPEFLLAAQAAVCFSGVIPVLLLCKKYKYGNTITFFAGLVFLCYPAFTCACFYDFHENVFLTPLILWLMYFVEGNSALGAAISGLLLLCVKEDAGVYLVIAGAYALIGKKSPKIIGPALIVMGIGGFVGVTAFINAFGDGIMIDRYRIFLTEGQDSVVDVVLNIIKNPAYFLNNILSAEKLLLIMQMLLPVLFIPMKSRRLSDWVLIVPLLLFNLATDYSYQHSIHYQYVFSSGAFLVFLFVKNFRYEKRKNKAMTAAVFAAAICLVGAATPKYYNIVRAKEEEAYFSASREALAAVPRDKVIYASTYMTPYLYDCPRVYMYPAIYNENELPEPDYVVLDGRPGVLAEYYELVDMYIEMGFVEDGSGGFVTVLKKP